jgi:uncharacterized protein (DUF433 family)
MLDDRIEITPDIRFGKPVIRGTRVPVTRILAEVAAGMPFPQIQREYGITEEDIRAAVAFANKLVSEQSFVLVASKDS